MDNRNRILVERYTNNNFLSPQFGGLAVQGIPGMLRFSWFSLWSEVFSVVDYVPPKGGSISGGLKVPLSD
jgi:hypothetical protein